MARRAGFVDHKTGYIFYLFDSRRGSKKPTADLQVGLRIPRLPSLAFPSTPSSKGLRLCRQKCGPLARLLIGKRTLETKQSTESTVTSTG